MTRPLPQEALSGVEHLLYFDPVDRIHPARVRQFKKGLMQIERARPLVERDAGTFGCNDLTGRGPAENPDGRDLEGEGDMEEARVVSDKKVHPSENTRDLAEAGLPRQIDDSAIVRFFGDPPGQAGFRRGAQKKNPVRRLLKKATRQLNVTVERPLQVMAPMGPRVNGDEAFSLGPLGDEEAGAPEAFFGNPNRERRERIDPDGPQQLHVLDQDRPVFQEGPLDGIRKAGSVLLKTDAAGCPDEKSEDRILQHPLTPARIDDEVKSVCLEFLGEAPFGPEPSMRPGGVVAEGSGDGFGGREKAKDRVVERGERIEAGLGKASFQGEDQGEGTQDVPDASGLENQDLPKRVRSAGPVRSAAKTMPYAREGAKGHFFQWGWHGASIISRACGVVKLRGRRGEERGKDANRN